MTTNRVAFDQLVKLLSELTAFCRRESRFTIIKLAGLEQFNNQIVWEGTAIDFTRGLLEVLDRYGTLPTGETRALDHLLDYLISDDSWLGASSKSDLQNLRSKLYTPIQLVPTYYDEDVLKYLRFIERKCAAIDSRLLGGDTQSDLVLPLEDVFITLKAGQNNPLEREAEQDLLDLDVAEMKQTLRQHIDELLEDEEVDLRYRKLVEECNMLSERFLNEQPRIVSLDTAICQHRWLVILGHPGSGKTIFTQWLCLQLARSLLADQEHVIVSGNKLGLEWKDVLVDLGPCRLPVPVRVADFAVARRANPSLALVDFLGHQPLWGEHTPVTASKLAEVIHEFLKTGQALVILDGLDEITESSDRREICRQIEQFAQDYISDPENAATFSPWDIQEKWWLPQQSSTPWRAGGNQLIVTSRIIGYRAAVLRREFAHYMIQPLDDSAIRRFCQMWTLAVERFESIHSARPVEDDGHLEGIAREKAATLINSIQYDSGVRKLATNPLLLTVLAILHREQAHLPLRRVRLYEQAIDVFAQRRLTRTDTSQLIDILGPFALWLHETQPTGLATEKELRDQIGLAWITRVHGLVPNQLALSQFNQEIGAFIADARQQRGLLVARGEGLYGFMHLTFQEYLVARELIRDTNQLVNNILRHLHRPRWHEPLMLAIGYLSEYQRGLLSGILEAVLTAPTEHDDVLHRNILFVADCIADNIWVPAIIVRRVAAELLEIKADRTGRGRFKVLREQIISTFKAIHQPGAAVAIEGILHDALTSEKPNLREAAAEILAEVEWGTTDLLGDILAALNRAGDPNVLWRGFTALLQRLSLPRAIRQPYNLLSLDELLEDDEALKVAYEAVSDADLLSGDLLRAYYSEINPFLTPLITRSLRRSMIADIPATKFKQELQVALQNHLTSAEGFAFAMMLACLIRLTPDQPWNRVIQQNIAGELRIAESLYLGLTAKVDFLNDAAKAGWWQSVSALAKAAFLQQVLFAVEDKLIASDIFGSVEEIAWTSLGEAAADVRTLALRLLTTLPHAHLSAQRLDLMQPLLIDPVVDIAELASSVLEYARNTDDPDELTAVISLLQQWLASDQEVVAVHGSLLLAEVDYITIPVYQRLTSALCSNNDHWRQWAASVMSRPHKMSQLSPDVLELAAKLEKSLDDSEDHSDGFAVLAHTQFRTLVVYDVSDIVVSWATQLEAAASDQAISLEYLLGGIHLCTAEVAETIMRLIARTNSGRLQTALMYSVSWLLRSEVPLPDTLVKVLSQLVEYDVPPNLRTLAGLNLGYFAARSEVALDELLQLSSAQDRDGSIAAIGGLGIAAIYCNQQDFSTRQIIEKLFRYTSGIASSPTAKSTIIQTTLQPMLNTNKEELREVALVAYCRALMAGNWEPSQILEHVLPIVDNQERYVLQLLFMAGDWDTSWDDVICSCGRGADSKVVETAQQLVQRNPRLLEQVAQNVIDAVMLHKSWQYIRIRIAVLAACAQDQPAAFAQLRMASILQSKLLESVQDSRSYNVRRFSMVTLGQFRVVSPKIVNILSDGCRDLGLVQRAVIHAIRALRRIDAKAIPKLENMLLGTSTVTAYAAALVFKEVGTSQQVIQDISLRTSIAGALARAIQSLTVSKLVVVDGIQLGLLDDVLYSSLYQILADVPEDIPDNTVESQLAFRGSESHEIEDLQNLLSKLEIMQNSAQIDIQQAGLRVVLNDKLQVSIFELNNVQHEEWKEVVSQALDWFVHIYTAAIVRTSGIAQESKDILAAAGAIPADLIGKHSEFEGSGINFRVELRPQPIVVDLALAGQRNPGWIQVLQTVFQKILERTKHLVTDLAESILQDVFPDDISAHMLHLIGTAEELSQAGDIQGAIDAIGQAIHLFPDMAVLYHQRGVYHYTLKEYDKAIADMTAAIIRDSDNAFYYAERAFNRRWNGELDLALADYSQALTLDPKNPAYHLERGKILHEQSEYEKAIVDFNQVSALDSTNANIYYLRANSYTWLSSHDKAIEDYTRALALDPTIHRYYYARSMSYASINNYSEARNDLDHAIALEPMNASFYYWRGFCYAQQKNPTASLADYTKAVDLEPANPQYCAALGRSLYVAGHTEQGSALIAQSLQLDPALAGPCVNFFLQAAQYHARRSEKSMVKVDLDCAINIAPSDPKLFYQRGQWNMTEENYAEATDDFTRAIALAPNQAEFYHSRGVAFYNLKNYGQAAIDFSLALERNPANDFYYRERGASKFYAGELQNAVDDLSQAIEISPTKAEYYQLRAQFWHVLRDYPASIADSSKAIELDPSITEQIVSIYQRSWSQHYQRSEYVEAIADVSCVISLFAQPAAELFHMRGVFEHRLGNYDNAIRDITEAVTREPNNSNYYRERAVSLAASSNYYAAIADLDRAIELDPEKADFFYQRGLCYIHSDANKQAIDNFTSAILLDSQVADYYYHRGEAYRHSTNISAAISDYEKAIQLHPHQGQYHYGLGLAHQLNNVHHLAKSDFERATELGYSDVQNNLLG